VSSFHDEFKVESPGVVIGRKGSLGTVYYVTEPFWPHDTTLWVRDFQGNDVRYCALLLDTLNLEELDAGSANPTLNRNHVHTLPVAIPGVAEQRRIVAEQLRGDKAFFAISTEELISSDESYQVEFKSTARWNLREDRKDKRMEDAVVKTIAGMLNTDGGTLVIGVGDDGSVMGLEHDFDLVKPKNADGLVNWLTTHLLNSFTHTQAMRTRARIELLRGRHVCRVDVAGSSAPVFARMSDGQEVFWIRMNNSTRELPEREVEAYANEHWSRP